MLRKILRVSLLVLPVVFSSCSYRFYPAPCEKERTGALKKTAALPDELWETSGLVFLNGLLYTFNDSDGLPVLFSYNTDSREIVKRTVIMNSTNADWEDIALDSSWFYIADVGNNFASRDTLTIYRVARDKVTGADPEVMHDGKINFSFEDQVTTDKRGFSSHDCEAIFVHHDSIYLFTKNWTDRSTSIYKLPSTPGYYRITPVFRYQVNALVTGADIDEESHTVILVGYRNYVPILITYDFLDDPGKIDCGGTARRYPFRTGKQVEGICFGEGGRIMVSSEAETRLHRPSLFITE